MMDYLRVFFAIHLQVVVQKQLQEVINKLKKAFVLHNVHWIALHNLHITLQFLPKIALDDVATLIAKVKVALANIASFELEFGDLEFFPSPNRFRIISMHIEPTDHMQKIATIIGEVIYTLGYPVETRPFRPHLTIGKLPTFFSTKSKEQIVQFPNIMPLAKTLITEICLFESKLGSKQSEYFLLEKFFLQEQR